MAKAFLFDFNGTMINDMEYHTIAWFDIINKDLQHQLSRDAVKKEMYGKNNDVLIRIFGHDHFTEEEMNRWSLEKERRYLEAYSPYVEWIPGLAHFLDSAHLKGIPMAIGSATITSNILYVLEKLNAGDYFRAVISADHVTYSKPHPETFLKAAEALGVAPTDCIVFEDSPKGVEAAAAAGMYAVVLTTMHEEEDFRGLSNILRFIKDYNDPYIRTLVGE
ncbi:HAD family phosphatase [Chitinophaga horti]|uniref:HAD family phosphatase n=1 Tax=Chitinophaga horti TaxID=2920382 RepID=A0ABY6J311_9BACT|nr:HAD family phosphatase [Chitinophaga horti]UYQ94053.1 HAD family phosphatase [Chitinophaga horti]